MRPSPPGMSIYILYGVRHSAERLRQQSQGDYIPLGQVTATEMEGTGDESKEDAGANQGQSHDSGPDAKTDKEDS